MSFRGRLALVLTASLVVAAPLVWAGGAASAATPTVNAPGSAVVGQAIRFTGTVPGGARKVVVYRWWASQNQTPITGTSDATGSYSISRRMMAMPTEYYRVVVPAPNGQPAWSSGLISVVNHMQDVNLTMNGSTFTAQPTLTTMDIDGKNPQSVNAGTGRVLDLQHRNADGSWTTIETSPMLTSDNPYTFTQTASAGAYRVLMRGTSSGIAAYPSFPVWVSEPTLTTGSVNDPAGASPTGAMPDSGNGAAQKYLWWPAAKFWDAEQGEGLSGARGQGCTSNCVPWSDYATGTGRVAVTDGQIALDSGFANKNKPVWGNLSSTMQMPGWTDGRWEMRAHHAEFVCPTCPTSVSGLVPFTTRVSLVPAGTPDGTTPAKRIVLAEWTGYSPNTKIRLAQGTGKATLSKTVTGVQWNRTNWNDIAVQITKARIVWFVNGKAVGQANGAATFGTAWVPRIEMISSSGKLMDRARSGLDWVRYFGANRPHAKPVPTVSALR